MVWNKRLTTEFKVSYEMPQICEKFREINFSQLFSYFFFHFKMELRTGIADMILRCSKLLWPFAHQFSETCIKLVFEAVNFAVTPISFTLVLDKIGNRTKHLLCSWMSVYIVMRCVGRSNMLMLHETAALTAK